MKIFFLAHIYFDLHKPILEELQRQGHIVVVEKDRPFVMDPYWRKENNLIRGAKYLYRWVTRLEINYWKEKIRNNPAYSDKYDLFLCINGTSFHPYLLNHFKTINPNIKSTLYLWDTQKVYDLFRNNKYFDRVLTFDLTDAENTEGVELLHSYWTPSSKKDEKYKLFSVGSDHDDRLFIFSKIYEQLTEAKLPSFLRVVTRKPQPNAGLFHRLFRKSNAQYLHDLEIWEQKLHLPFVTNEKLSIDEIIKYIDESECILDTDMPVQTGATQRVIWALARGKKIISTNDSLKKFSFFDSKQIRLIDRDNPVIDIEFLKTKEIFPVCKEIQDLRIDKWVRRLIDFE